MNKEINFSLLFIDKEKYKKDDIVICYILSCENYEGLLHELIVEKSHQTPELSLKSNKFFADEENRY